MKRTLFLIAYDISNARRLARVHYFLKGYSTGGQKSVYECFLTTGELNSVQQGIRELIEEADDRIHIFTMDARSRTHTMGVAIQPHDPAYFYIG